MTNEEKIKKWLAGELSEAEKKDFEDTEEFAKISKLLKAAHHFRAPEYSMDSEYRRLSEKLFSPKTTISIYERISPFFKIAAILILALTIGYFSYTHLKPASNSQEWITGQADIYLPDSSFVSLNAGSKISYSDKQWKKARKVELTGEAFFRVKKGSQFHVKTQQGTVTALGTEFSVKDWENYFQVSCYSGSVKVSTQGKSLVLQANSGFRIVNGTEETYAFSNEPGPDWLKGESRFKSVPLKFVIHELERQYKIPVEIRNVDLNQIFTGSFTHQDIEIALKSITLPLHLHYEMNENKIVITIEGK